MTFRKSPTLVKKLALRGALFAIGALLCSTAAPATGSLLTGHSHWDDPNANYELKICYDVLGNTPGFGSVIAHIPFREQTAANFYDLRITTSGFQLERRVNNVATTIAPSFSTPHTFGVGSDIMFDLVAEGNTFTLYQLNDNNTRGPEWYQWQDDTYSRGVNISYYTVNHWDGRWDNIFATALDDIGINHQIHGLLQDARNVPAQTSGEVTFDSDAPASGSVEGVTQAKAGSTETWGLASGPQYTYALTVDHPGTGRFDFRDPAGADLASFFADSFYRLTLGTTPAIQRFVGSSPGTVYKAPTGTGVAGTYRLDLDGPTITLVAPSGQTLITVDDGGPQSGVRVRLSPGDQTWTWVGVPGLPASTPVPVYTPIADPANPAGPSGGSDPAPTTPAPTTPTTTTTTTNTTTSSTATISSPAGTTDLTPTADAYVASANATSTYGGSTALYVDSDTPRRSYLRFDLSKVSGTISGAVLKIHASSSQSVGYDVSSVNGSWQESTIDWANAPSLGTTLGSSGPVSSGTWTSVTLSASQIQAAVGHVLDLALTTTSATNLHLDSRESANAPELVLTTG